LFLFRSFSAHREELGRRWFARGQRDLATARATDAIFDLRTALGYAPADSDYQFLLAEALKDAGKIEEATTYFSELREADPGSGPLNLQLARLSEQKKNASDALHYYRAAIYGTWDDNPVGNRRTARLELIRNLLATNDHNTARTELLIASEDANDDATSQTQIASMMIEAGDNASALDIFQKTLARIPGEAASLEGAGNAAFNLGHYASAERYLKKAAERRTQVATGGLSPDSAQRLAEATRILQLFPASGLPKAEQGARIERIAAMTQTQLAACQLKTDGHDATGQLTTFDEAWKTNNKLASTKLRNDPTTQRAELQLIYGTLEQTHKYCKSSSADDLLLQRIATYRDTILQ
jgi:tetratricopeptide (TPR) repeat protein